MFYCCHPRNTSSNMPRMYAVHVVACVRKIPKRTGRACNTFTMHLSVQVWNEYTWNWLQLEEKEQDIAGDDVDGSSSDGTGYSTEGELEPSTMVATEGAGDAMAAMNVAIASIAKTQAIMIEKLTLMERAVATVQFDMMWLRDDLKEVHNVMDNIAGHVCDLGDATTEVDALHEQVSVDANMRQAYTEKGNDEDCAKGPSVSTSPGEEVGVQDVDRQCKDARNDTGTFIEETQSFENIVNTHMTRLSSPDGAREREWGSTRHAPLALCSPPRQSIRESIEANLFQEESHPIEMSCPSSQLQTPLSGRSMWKDFAAAVRDWPPPPPVQNARAEGWVSTKKGRWDTIVYGEERVNTVNEANVEPQTALNLNMPPEKYVTMEGSRRGWDVAPSKTIVESSKNGGNGRGTTRGRRPPAVQPQYHRTVSCGNTREWRDVVA